MIAVDPETPRAVLTESDGLRTTHAMCQARGGHASSLPCGSQLSVFPGKEISQPSQLNSSFPRINSWGDECRRDCLVVQTPASNLPPFLFLLGLQDSEQEEDLTFLMTQGTEKYSLFLCSVAV